MDPAIRRRSLGPSSNCSTHVTTHTRRSFPLGNSHDKHRQHMLHMNKKHSPLFASHEKHRQHLLHMNAEAMHSPEEPTRAQPVPEEPTRAQPVPETPPRAQPVPETPTRAQLVCSHGALPTWKPGDPDRPLPMPNRNKILAMQTRFSREQPDSVIPTDSDRGPASSGNARHAMNRCNLNPSKKKIIRLSPRAVPPQQGKNSCALYLLFVIFFLLMLGGPMIYLFLPADSPHRQ